MSRVEACGEWQVKCRQCRRPVLEQCEAAVVDGHGAVLGAARASHTSCGARDPVLYVDEELAPSWVLERVHQADWTRGRLNCPSCGARIGSFDFTSGSRCSCSQSLLPPIRFIKTKLDI